MPVYVYHDGAWRESTPSIHVDGSARGVHDAYVRVPAKLGGIWKRAYQRAPDRVIGLSLVEGTYRSVLFSWPTVPTAVGYEVWRNGQWILNVVNNRFFDDNVFQGLNPDTSYVYQVRAVNVYGVAGAYSPVYEFYTGSPESRDTGSTTVLVDPVASGSWRGDAGWGRVGQDVRQGYYTYDYGSGGYAGVVDYGVSAIRDAIRAEAGGGSLGTNRQLNGTCTSARVYLVKESGVGSADAVTATFYTVTTGPSGGQPALQGTGVSLTTTVGGKGKWYSIGTTHGQRLGDGGARSVALYRNSKADYASFVGADGGGANGRIEVKWSWNYVTEAGQPWTWARVD